MRRILVVGCGGSGGATLAYLMDQLRSDLGAHDIAELPRAWQFVHIDVPSKSDPAPDNLGIVTEQGGNYFGCSPTGLDYRMLDRSVSDVLGARGALDVIATWAPKKPSDVHVPIAQGAGQFRSVGRMITLSRASDIHNALSSAATVLRDQFVEAEMRRMGSQMPALGSADMRDPIVLVVSSMAGGAGASMALDVCRILSQVNGLGDSSLLTAVFMASANIFDGLPKASRSGVRANALAMLGEIVASQTGAAHRHDHAALEALGLTPGGESAIPFARVFPVGRFVGIGDLQFGDGSKEAVYRGLGRGLAALMMSDKALAPFVAYDLTNTGAIPGRRDLIGWGSGWEQLQWGSFGFASLSMGRDRYAEYSAQRIARSCVDRLLKGQLEPNNPALATEQTRKLLEGQWRSQFERAGVPTDGSHVDGWIRGGYWFPTNDVVAEAQNVVSTLVDPVLPAASGEGMKWLNAVNVKLAQAAPAMVGAADAAATRLAFVWHRKLVDAVEQEVSRTISSLGLPYTVAVIERMAGHVRDVLAPSADMLCARPSMTTLPPEVQTTLARMRGAVAHSNPFREQVLISCRNNVQAHMYARVSELVGELLRQFSTGVLAPMAEALREAQQVLEYELAAQPSNLGLAQLVTNSPSAWPSDDDLRVADRFDEADNELLLTTSAEYDRHYDAHLLASNPMGEWGETVPKLDEARKAVASSVIAGVWKDQGGVPCPGGLFVRGVDWRPQTFPVDPTTGDPYVGSRAHYKAHVLPRELVERARVFVDRRDESFHKFCNVSITDYVTSGTEFERAQQRQDLIDKFRQTLSLALPLISVNPAALRTVHDGVSVQYRFKFSEVPFRGSIDKDLLKVVHDRQDIDDATEGNLEAAFGDTKGITRIDIFGSYPNYSPLVFDAVLRPVREEWAAIPENARMEWWKWRRSRPLDAALPMGEAERRAMVGGWMVGLITGRISLPPEPFKKAVRIWDEDEDHPGWTAFPYPLLAPRPTIQTREDLLPAVLESVLLAIARSHDAPVMSSLRPYQLLRGLYDDGVEGPTAGMDEQAAYTLLADWLETGTSPAGPSALSKANLADTAAGRAEAASAWLTELRAVAEDFIPADEFSGENGKGPFSVISSRTKAAETPMFRDIAPDVFAVAGELIETVRAAAGAASAPVYRRTTSM